MKPLCFVLMPFGIKTDSLGRKIDFDAVYAELIGPAVAEAGMEVVRADEEQVGGIIHKPMFERLMLCEYAVADITGGNPNVFYELGVRHALRPRSTIVVFATGSGIPFDIAHLRGLPYAVTPGGRVAGAKVQVAALAKSLNSARTDHADDSPVFQLVEDMPRVQIDHAKTDVFRRRVDYAQAYKDRLALARRGGADVVRRIAAEPGLANLADVETGIVVDLFLSLRGVKAFEDMLGLYDRMPRPLQRARMIREQLGFALNRLGRHEEAETVLRGVIEEFGPSSETNGLLGRVYKDRWEAAAKAGRAIEAKGHLARAIDTYITGFEADWRDAYPGINALTLLEMQGKPDPRQAELVPVVRYAATRRAASVGDYWDYATLLEIAVLADEPDAAATELGHALAQVREPWEPETTARNLSLIRDRRRDRGIDTRWIQELIDELEATHRRLAKGQGQ